MQGVLCFCTQRIACGYTPTANNRCTSFACKTHNATARLTFTFASPLKIDDGWVPESSSLQSANIHPDIQTLGHAYHLSISREALGAACKTILLIIENDAECDDQCTISRTRLTSCFSVPEQDRHNTIALGLPQVSCGELHTSCVSHARDCQLRKPEGTFYTTRN